MNVSLVARLDGIQLILLFKWKKQYQEDSLTAVAVGEEVVPASELATALKQVRELQRLLDKNTMEVEILKEAVEYGQSRKWIAHARLLPKDGKSSGQLRHGRIVRVNRSANWLDRRSNWHNDEADAEVLSDVLGIISDMSSYGYRRVWGSCVSDVA